MRVSQLASALLLALTLTTFTCVAWAESPTFTVKAALDKPAYYIGETPTLSVELTWQHLTQNYTVKYVLVNSTGHEVATLATAISATAPNGTHTGSYSLTGFTSEPGEFSYELRVIDEGSALTVATASFTILVKTADIRLSVAWDDASGDRLIEPYESVEFKIFITWAFVNETVTYALYRDGQLIDNVQLTAGSGTTQKLYITTFDNTGVYSLNFKLQDSEGKVAAQRAIAVEVKEKVQLVQRGASLMEQGFQWLKQNSLLVIVVLGLLLIALVIVRHR